MQDKNDITSLQYNGEVQRLERVFLLEDAKRMIDKARNMTEISATINAYAISLVDDITLQKYKASEPNIANEILLQFYRNSSVYKDALELLQYTPKRFHNTTIYKQLLASYTALVNKKTID
jgi:translation initiation factor 2 beta subunit (eIF-2beta)/eIF-5